MHAAGSADLDCRTAVAERLRRLQAASAVVCTTPAEPLLLGLARAGEGASSKGFMVRDEVQVAGFGGTVSFGVDTRQEGLLLEQVSSRWVRIAPKQHSQLPCDRCRFSG